MYLKQITIVRAFQKRGWCWDSDRRALTSPDLVPGTRIFGAFEHAGWVVRLYDARLREHSNVHVVSYWGPFENTRELEAALVSIEQVYSNLCGTRFAKGEV